MRYNETLKTRVSPEIKLQAKAVAVREFLSEAAWLKRLVMREILASDNPSRAEKDVQRSESIPVPIDAVPLSNGAGKPMQVRLTLKRSIAELGSIGRNINQIAKVVTGGGELPGSLRSEFWAMLKVCSALRDHTKALLKANLASWLAGHVQDGH
jgi:hypothetical protein